MPLGSKCNAAGFVGTGVHPGRAQVAWYGAGILLGRQQLLKRRAGPCLLAIHSFIHLTITHLKSILCQALVGEWGEQDQGPAFPVLERQCWTQTTRKKAAKWNALQPGSMLGKTNTATASLSLPSTQRVHFSPDSGLPVTSDHRVWEK